MYLPTTPTREILERLLFPPMLRLCPSVRPHWDGLANVGLVIVERRDPLLDNGAGYTCAEYVFSTLLGEEWVGRRAPAALFSDTHSFLERRGYVEITPTFEGEVVIYGVDIKGRFQAQHFGMATEGKVVSKFEAGHVVLHDLEAVPSSYGDTVRFYRKN